MDAELLAAIKNDQYDHARRLIKRRIIDLTATNTFGCTFMHYAVFHSSIDIVRLLAKKERSIIDALNNALISPLHIACEKGRTDVVEFLLQSNSKAAAVVDVYDYRPRDCAERFGFSSVIVLLDQYRTINK